MQKVSILFLVIGLTMLVSCHRDPVCSVPLITADSLIMHGQYYEADSFLALYDQNPQSQNELISYRQLLFLERLFVDEALTEEHFSLADSLYRFYKNENQLNKYSKTLCILGEIYRKNQDYPSAINCFLEAKDLANTYDDSYLLCWIYHKVGDIYFDQQMYDVSTDYYQNYFNLASFNQDTLRMAYAAFRLGKSYTARDNVDSTLYYYKNAIDLARHTNRSERIVPPAYNSLCDIYIQIEEFEKAKEYFLNDSTDDVNLAYWHLGQNHVDSAIYYFEKIKYRYNTIGRLETCHNLAQLEEKRGNVQKALQYYNYEKVLTDSVKEQSQADEIKKVDTRHRFELLKKERDDLSQNNQKIKYVLFGILFLMLILCYWGIYVWKVYHQRRVANLEQSLADAHKKSSEYQKAVNRNIEIMQRMQSTQLEVLQNSPLYAKIHVNSHKSGFHLSDSEWQELAMLVDEAYNNFTQRLQSLVDVSQEELKTCYLLKINVSSVDIANIVCKTNNAIYMQQKRLYEKITLKKGTVKDFTQFISRF